MEQLFELKLGLYIKVLKKSLRYYSLTGLQEYQYHILVKLGFNTFSNIT